MDGALLIDKPAGASSFDVVRTVRKLFGEKRVGHAGTLDPFATGLLVVLLGKATRLQEIFLGATKGYTGELLVGVSTDSEDITGDITRSEVMDDIGCDEIDALVEKNRQRFVGKGMQVPPSFSALKVNGDRSYALARKGTLVTHAAREIEIEQLVFESARSEEKTIRIPFAVRCSKGTYIRALARDFGEAIGYPCCLSTLRRTESSPYTVERAVSIESLERDENRIQRVVPMNLLISHLPRFVASPEKCSLIRLGNQRVFQEVTAATEPSRGEGRFAGIFDSQGELHGIAERVTDDTGRAFRLRCVLP